MTTWIIIDILVHSDAFINMHINLKNWLETGKYSRIIDQLHKIEGTDKKYLLAALSFSGEIDQAQVLFQKTKWKTTF